MLTHPCNTLPGVGPTLALRLATLGIHTLTDLLFHLPYRYQDRTRITPIGDLKPNEWCVVTGNVCKTEIKYGKKRMLYCTIEDKTGLLKLRFFHFNQAQVSALNQNPRILVFGEVRTFQNSLEMIHPEYQLLKEDGILQVEETLTPIYPTTQGLSQTKLRQLIKNSLALCQEELNLIEWMSNEQLQANQLVSLSNAIGQLHHPTPDISLQSIEEGMHPALKRVAFDELLAQRLSMQFARQQIRTMIAPALPKASQTTEFFANLPFTLTKAQQRVFEEIQNDLQSPKPMLRLVQGDVGAGKTVIAALAAIQAISAGFQVAFMAPTDLLSEQHENTLAPWFARLQISVYRLSGKMKQSHRKKIQTAISSNEAKLIIGTHALFQDKIKFSCLGLVIIDEQHRFGVEQRLLLQQKANTSLHHPHQLLMTATPIPRTLAMTHYAHLDLSIINELPPNRTPIITAVLHEDKRDDIIMRLKDAINNGRQAYWVCTLIEDSEKLQCMAATVTAERLQQILSHARIGLIHGRMKLPEKEQTMADFKSGAIDLLVATTVIEVGVDVPNASLMIIENAERLGLSQLHQLRGRVGRGSLQSHCLLLYQGPLSKMSAERLRIMRNTCDGFVIAEHDLQLRGAGEMLGSRQTGFRQFKVAQLPRDKSLLPEVVKHVSLLIKDDPETARSIATRWLGEFEHFLKG